jgi:peroxin-1
MQSKRKLASLVSRDGIAGTRGSSTSAREQDVATVELDATFARLLGITDGQKIGVDLHVDPPMAHTINIEPLTPADWEMIELHAQFLELNFLNQVRAVPNPAYTPGEGQDKQAVAHPITLHLSPTSTANITATSIVPIPPNNSPFVKISPDAEVIVAPKTRKTEKSSTRDGNRSVGGRSGGRSTGGRSAASTVRHRSSKEPASKGVTFLRGVSRKLASEWFDDFEEAEKDTGLKVWVDKDQLLTKALRGVTWVSVGVVKPAGILEPVDPQKDAAETEKPSTKVVARIVPWEDAPDSSHVALSTLLCQSLGVDELVGGLIRIEAAPTQAAKATKTEGKESSRSKEVTVKSLKILPFPSSAWLQKSGFKFGGESKQEKEESLRNLQALFGKDGNGLMLGPLTDGMILPSTSKDEIIWPGGILRFDPPNVPSDGRKPPVGWYLGAERSLNVEVQAEIPRPTISLRSWSPGEALPTTPPVLVGIDSTIEQLNTHLCQQSSVLLTGGLGAGKTSLAHAVSHRLRHEYLFHVVYFSCRSLVNDETRVSTIKETLNRLFQAAQWGARLGGKSIVILDDLDRLCPAETELEVSDNARSKHVSECLIAAVRQYCTMGSGIVLLALASAKEALHNVIVGGHVVREIVNLSAPNKDGRRKVLEKLAHGDKKPQENGSHFLEDTPANSRPGTSDGQTPGFNVSPDIDFLDVAGQTDGYMPGDLVFLTSRARSECLIRTIAPVSHKSSTELETPTLTLTAEDYTAALKGFTPASLRNVTLQTSTVQWSSIGGLQNTRQMLLETLQYPTTYAPIFSKCPLRLRSGLLLYGYPGCGKTLLASAIASQTGLNFISVKGPEILNKYIGASEKSVRDLFERAQAARPCVLFFDEFDSIAPKRGHDSTGVTDRVVNQLLTQMDGAEGLSGVYVLAATSRPDLIDPALLRPGRLDKSLECGMPTFEDRADILRAVAQKVRVGHEVTSRWDDVARETEGYSGADLQAVVYNAQLEAVHDVLGEGDLDPSKFGKGGGNSKKATKGLPEFSHFRFGDRELEFDEEVGSKALAERAQVAQKIRDLQNLRRKQKLLTQPPAPAPSQTSSRPRYMRSISYDSGDSDSLPNSVIASPTKTANSKQAEVNGDDDEAAGSKEPIIQWRHIQASLSSTRPSITPADRKRLARIYGEFVDARSGDLPSGQGGTDVGARSTLM